MLTVKKYNVLPEKPDMSPCRYIESMQLETGLSKPLISCQDGNIREIQDMKRRCDFD
jgi:hypothetical protein